MKIVGLTGGIGSGKTTVAKMFQELGVPVYIADIEAKKLTNSSKIIHRKLTQLLGKEAYTDGVLNRVFVAKLVFNDATLLKAVNEIIHPKVAQHFKRWVKKQHGPYCVKEAAILFENGSYVDCDLTILVTAPVEERIRRVQQRDYNTREAIVARMNNQWSDEKKIKLADVVIHNLDLASTKIQIKNLHAKLSEAP
ncbi:dephospho-CoA kinase [Rasiella rasia]|uniref:Dephospho-CoA kinase n=1 Tax=Rasiella rasia TaxID=2744027 RepID=A0A6G6GQH9_9FLAO|nr:dephospho-CoA kinase [Rasiella rasia]QIE60724.1 dephospho-CoA kinase [Rasiella rasia]